VSAPVLLIATANPGKRRELAELLRPLSLDLRDLGDYPGAPRVSEDADDYAGNARRKAVTLARFTGVTALADDSGLEVDALGGGPGVRTRRFAGARATDEQNNTKLLAELAGLPAERRRARYRCVLALARPDRAGPRGGIPVTLARGTFEGRIGAYPRGSNGFGYDPIFEPASEPPGGATVGEWPPERKRAVSHRARAAHRMAPVLRSLGL
jgi:XTP/dITP diphosphohydrolase